MTSEYTKILERWTSVHAFKYFEKYDHINSENIFEYVDSAKSNVLSVLLSNYSYNYVMAVFTETLHDFK